MCAWLADNSSLRLRWASLSLPDTKVLQKVNESNLLSIPVYSWFQTKLSFSKKHNESKPNYCSLIQAYQ